MFIEGDVETTDVCKISEEVLFEVEADSFWCLSKLLDGIQVRTYMDEHPVYLFPIYLLG
jgi:hypothetical protein